MAVVDLGLGSDHHRAAGELAVVKSQKQAGALIEALRSVDSHREGPAIEASQRQKNRRLVADFSPSAEAPRAQRGDVRRKSHAQQVDEINDTGAVTQTHHVAGTAPMGQQRLDRVFHAAIS